MATVGRSILDEGVRGGGEGTSGDSYHEHYFIVILLVAIKFSYLQIYQVFVSLSICIIVKILPLIFARFPSRMLVW